VGDVTLPPAGYQSRFSDSLNRAEAEFVPLTNVELTSHGDGSVVTIPFLALNTRHVRLSYPLHSERHVRARRPPREVRLLRSLPSAPRTTTDSKRTKSHSN